MREGGKDEAYAARRTGTGALGGKGTNGWQDGERATDTDPKHTRALLTGDWWEAALDWAGKDGRLAMGTVWWTVDGLGLY